ncbi:MAG: Gfo/Idh/MocA family oxidoreductase [Armatimonadetes bacterium]|nr:Gfo/Idh/MocA family oxidoreductase [Armatimonadota bacterium]
MSREEWGIAVVGLGGIARHHLQSYQSRGLRVVGGADVDEIRGHAAREAFDLPFVTTDPEALIARPDVRVVDLTVPHVMEIRRPLVEAAARHGKALFVQKPLMPTLKDARVLVEIAEASDVPMMVNQNSIFAPQALRIGERFGAIGEPYYFQIDNRAWVDPTAHPWFGKSERWVNSDMAIHHYALVRHWFGDAESVSAHLARDPSQPGVKGETLSAAMIRFKSGVSGLVVNNWCYRGPEKHPHPNELILLQGSNGTISAHASEVVISTAGGEERLSVEGSWFPDAFGSAMAHFVDALDGGTPFLCEARDNLKSLAIAEAGYRSAAERREVRVEEALEEAGIQAEGADFW